ncbi:heparinase II/III family protein [Dyadobacter sp. CY343]|uniref:heparinase II/III domain-containing protein n=1 Tax=Dyadobacter sp. CY343 TaxID=2907299 RepID=UPI001F3B1B7C|nr:heparinase II/III family protein [Dyadobacter sp. CY343]MCE7059491.1 heparinase II/III-family protein [Dyadobacter sp. CY343]
MKKILFLLLLGAWSATAQVTPRNILEKAYSVEFVQQMLVPRDQWKPYPTDPAAWKAAVPDSVLTRIINEAEKLLEYKFEPVSASISLDFVRSGDRLRHSAISFDKRNVLMKLILAESMENKGRFTEAIMNGVWSICEESFWGVPAHIGKAGLPDPEKPIVDLFAAETAAVLGYADHFTGGKLDKINPLIRKRIYFETNKRIFIPMLTYGDEFAWMSKTKEVNNWNPWIMSNWIAATLLLEKDEKRRAEMLRGSMVGLDRYINSLGVDGGCDEGPSYWFAAGASVYDCLELLAGATNAKIDIYQEDIIKKMASYVYKTHIDGHYFVNFADADPKLRPDGLLLYRLGKAVKDEKLVEMGQWAFQDFPGVSTSPEGFHRPRKIENLLTINKMSTEKVTLKPVHDAWISDIQVLTARAGNGLFLATHGGHNAESHNHNDVGDFIIYVKGQPMIVDAGRGNYTARTFSNKRYELWFTQSEYHNLPIVNGIGQKAGRKFEAKSVKSTVNAKEASLQMDIAAAYPPEAGITSWNRLVRLNRVKNQVEVSDDYNLKTQPESVQQIFMTVCDVDTSEPGKVKLKGAADTNLTLSYDPKAWTVSTEKPSTDGMEYESFKTKWDSRPVTRIVLASKQLKQKGKYLMVFDTK